MAKKGTAEYEEWLRHYREKRKKAQEEPSQPRQKKQVQQELFSPSEIPSVEVLPKGTKRQVYSKSQNKDLEVEIIRFVPSSGKYLCKRSDNKFLYYSEEDFKEQVKQTQPQKQEQHYTNAKKDSLSVVPEGSMSAKIEKNVSPIVWNMSKTGLKLDKDTLSTLKAQAEETLEAHKKELEEAVGHSVNYNNPREVANLLYNELGLPPKEVITSKGQVLVSKSTSAEDLAELAERTGSQIPGMISQLRSDHRIISAYINKLEKIASRGDGRLRNLFLPSTVSGRFATKYNPTLIEVPDSIKTEDKIYFPPDLEEIGMGSVCPLH